MAAKSKGYETPSEEECSHSESERTSSESEWSSSESDSNRSDAPLTRKYSGTTRCIDRCVIGTKFVAFFFFQFNIMLIF